MRYRKLKYKIKAALKNSRKQEKIINQLKLKNETLNNEKQKELRATEERYNKLEMEKQRLENENQNYLINFQSYEREKQKYQNDLQEKHKEFQVFEERFNRLEIENRRLESENQECKDGLEEEQQKFQLSEHEKLINERLKKEELENEKLKIEAMKKEIGSANRKFKFVTSILIAIIIGQIKSGFENQKIKNDLQGKTKAIEEQYNTFIKRELLVY